MIYVLFNPYAGIKGGEDRAKKVSDFYPGKEMAYVDITSIKEYAEFFAKLSQQDEIVICGGDGTLNRFINDTADLKIKNSILYYATGNGNDFLRDLEKDTDAGPIRINKYIKHLPTVTVDGKTYRFLNGVGYGIDGYCCEVGDKLRLKGKKANYTGIAIKGLLFRYRPVNATVTVDGKTNTYKKVWLAPTMKGRYYGGGMMPTPEQNRNDRSGGVSLMVIHKAGKLRTLCVFPSIFKGNHVKRRAMVDVLSGHSITVEFDRPTALQIDGETVRNVTKYQVESGAFGVTPREKHAAAASV